MRIAFSKEDIFGSDRVITDVTQDRHFSHRQDAKNAKILYRTPRETLGEPHSTLAAWRFPGTARDLLSKSGRCSGSMRKAS
jgi:hypothetical protein